MLQNLTGGGKVKKNEECNKCCQQEKFASGRNLLPSSGWVKFLIWLLAEERNVENTFLIHEVLICFYHTCFKKDQVTLLYSKKV